MEMCEKMKTLVIHPDDPTTDFLMDIYSYLDCDVLSGMRITSEDVTNNIPLYDRIICLGHGGPGGLFGNVGYLIDESHVDLLRGKELICIWCNANEFMVKHGLKGFYSGMFISELGEAMVYDINCTQKDITDSNELFAKLLGEFIDTPQRLSILQKSYKIWGNRVTAFNRERLYETYK